MSEVKSLRAADLGYEWPKDWPDGTTWTRYPGHKMLWPPNSGVRFSTAHGCWIGTTGSALVDGWTAWLGPSPDFGERPDDQCILVKGQEPELPPCPPGDGWIEWSGGECPVPPDIDVDVQLRNGEVTISVAPGGDSLAGDWCWEVNGYECDIVRYRVHQPKYRPYTDDEMKQLVRVGEYLERKDGTAGSRAWDWQCWDSVIYVRVGLAAFKAVELLEHLQHADGRPCGVEVSDQ